MKPADNVQHARIEDGLARLLLKQAPITLSANLLYGTLWATAVWAVLDHQIILAWFGGLGLVTLLRMILVVWHRRHDDLAGKRLHRMANLYAIGALASGVFWASAGIMLINTGDPAMQALAGFIMGGMAAGAVTTSAPHLMSYFAFALPLLVPLPPLLVLEGGRLQIVMAVMCVGFILLLNKTVRRLHETLRDSIALGLENASLVEGLEHELAERNKTEEALFMEKELAQTTLKSLGDAVVTTDLHGHVLTLNPAGETLTGVSELAARGNQFGQVFRLSAGHGGNAAMEDPVSLCLSQGRPVFCESHLRLLDSENRETYSVAISASPIRDRSGETTGVVVVCHDVSALSYAASHDALTGLVNRREFLVRLERAIASTHIDLAEHALCYIDLDRFKVVNDTCGHAAGDALLKELTALLQGQTRDGDTFARLGGDEFGLLLPFCPPEKAWQIADSLRAMTHDFRFHWEGRTFEIGASIGLVHIRKNSGNSAELLRAADSACYAAKAGGRNRVQIYQPDDQTISEHQQHITWVSRIQQAMDLHAFTLYCQPIQSMKSGKNGFFEVLLRLRDGQGGLIPPSVFLPAAERYGLMPALDRWVIRNALAKLAPLLAQDHAARCAINLSGQSLNDERMVDFILDEIDSHRIDPASLCFEITETTATTRLGKARELAGRLKSHGCLLALDDFGSGISAFSYLKELPLDFVKIDGAFVRNIEHHPGDRAILSAIVEVARAMGKQTIIESIEQASSMECLRKLGVDFAQGYALAMPRPLDEFAALPQASQAA